MTLHASAYAVGAPGDDDTYDRSDGRFGETEQTVLQRRKIGRLYRDEQDDDEGDRRHLSVVGNGCKHADDLFETDRYDHADDREGEAEQIEVGHQSADEGAQHPQPALLHGVVKVLLLLDDDCRGAGKHGACQTRRFMKMRGDGVAQQIGSHNGTAFRGNLQGLQSVEYFGDGNHRYVGCREIDR